MVIKYREPKNSEFIKINNILIKYGNLYTPRFTNKERNDEINHIKNNQAYCLLAVENNLIIGYLVWEKYKKNPRYAYICNLLVEPKHQRKGISIQLRKIAFSNMKSMGFVGVYYTTWDKNIGIIKSSKKLGIKIEDFYLDEKFRGKAGKTYLFKKEFSS